MFPILNENSSKIGQYSVQKHRPTEIQQNLLELSAFILPISGQYRPCLKLDLFQSYGQLKVSISSY